MRACEILFRKALPPEHADGRVRIEHVTVALFHVVHDAERLFVMEAAAQMSRRIA